jgi:site-specific DNA-methyltransferase (adenine-specific)
MNDISLICGDSLQILKMFSDEMFDCILTDPPYNISLISGGKITRNGGKFGSFSDIKLDFGEWDYNKVLWQDFIDDFARILKPCGVLICFYNCLEVGQIGLYLQNRYNFQVRHIGAWVKSNPVPQARKVKLSNGLELFLIATKNKGTGHHFNWQLGQSPDYFIHSVSYKHYHPTQKPLPLIEWLLNYWTFENDYILDPFCGSGTTGVACAKLNRKFIGIDIDYSYLKIAKMRLGNHRQLSII